MAITQIKGSNIEDGTVLAADIIDDSITNAKIKSDAAIAQSKLVDIVDADIAANAAIGATKLASTLDLSGNTVTLPADCVDGTKIADDAINSEHYAAASIDAEHLAVGKDGAFSLDGSPNTDNTAVGPQTNTLASGFQATITDLVVIGNTSKWIEADADATSTSIGLLGIALEAKNDTQLMNVALPGSFVRGDGWNWTPGAVLYIGNTPGAMVESPPTGTGDVVRTVGYAVTPTVVFLNPSSDYVTLA